MLSKIYSNLNYWDSDAGHVITKNPNESDEVDNRSQSGSESKEEAQTTKKPVGGGETYEVFENWAKKGDFPNQLEPHQCDRVCKPGEAYECRYTFNLELHTSMGKVNYTNTLKHHTFKILNIKR